MRRLVELPIGATEDRVVGSLDLQKVLRDGEHAFSPGLLAQAHGGVLYVDEVNLLGDHLVDVLLDAAAMGRVHIERDGVSHSHEARFMLIGTMNPEEGELRPQLLDRFGLTVDVRASRDVDVRADVIRRAAAVRVRPGRIRRRYADADAELARRIAAARATVGDVELPDHELRRIAALCAAFGVDGMRADLVVARTAVAHAAWRGAGDHRCGGHRVAAELALPHRRRRDPFDEPGLDPAAARRGTGRRRSDRRTRRSRARIRRVAVTITDRNDHTPPQVDSPAPRHARARRRRALPHPALTVPGVGDGAPGRRSRARNRTGAVILAPDPTTASACISSAPSWPPRAGSWLPGPPRWSPTTCAARFGEGREANLVIFLVDASGSMAARDRMAAVSGATLSLLRDAYQRRDKVAVITFRDSGARCCYRRRPRCMWPRGGSLGSTRAVRRRWRRGCWRPATW